MESISNRLRLVDIQVNLFYGRFTFNGFVIFKHESAGPNSGNNRVYELDTIFVTAERTENPLSASTGAASMLTAADIQRYPISNISDALALNSRIVFSNRDGLARIRLQPSVVSMAVARRNISRSW